MNSNNITSQRKGILLARNGVETIDPTGAVTTAAKPLSGGDGDFSHLKAPDAKQFSSPCPIYGHNL